MRSLDVGCVLARTQPLLVPRLRLGTVVRANCKFLKHPKAASANCSRGFFRTRSQAPPGNERNADKLPPLVNNRLFTLFFQIPSVRFLRGVRFLTPGPYDRYFRSFHTLTVQLAQPFFTLF